MTGIIPLYKEENITSFFALHKLRRIVGEKKAGHTGTLDPNATGVLPIALGGATRFIELLPDHKKTYEATFKLGVETDTLDIWGKVIKTNHTKIEDERVFEESKKFIGEIEQLPPMYSAIRKDGVRLYELARQGKEVEREKRKCTIYDLEVKKLENGEFSLYCECSKGTYIRTLISDIGDNLGVGACMTSLKRTTACGITIDKCYKLNELEELMDKGEIEKAIIPVEELLSCYPYVKVTEKQGVRFKNGGDLLCDRVRGLKDYGIYRVYFEDDFLGLGEYTEGSTSLNVKRVYNGR